MIACLTGKVSSISGDFAIIDVQGVGYEVRCTRACLSRLEVAQAATVIVYTEVREDALNLYGFANQAEKGVFQLLLKVKGVGARSASEMLSNVESQDLLRAIGSGDINKLQTVKGVGKKTAERLVVELRDRVTEFVDDNSSLSMHIERSNHVPANDAIDALVALGFQRKQAENALSKINVTDISRLSSGELVREALRCI